MKTYAFVFARGGSKRIPGKNIRSLAGKPLIAYAIELAKEVPSIDKIFVSTEDDRIASIAKKYGAAVILRPEELAQDNSPEWLAWKHAVDWVETNTGAFSTFISLPATAPLRNKDDVESCLQRLDEDTDIVVTITETNRSPWFNMVQEKDDGHVSLLVEGAERYNRVQDVPEAFDMTTVAYVTRPQYIRKAGSIFDGRVKAVKIPADRALDIDTELDFQIAEYLMGKITGKEVTNNK